MRERSGPILINYCETTRTMEEKTRRYMWCIALKTRQREKKSKRRRSEGVKTGVCGTRGEFGLMSIRYQSKFADQGVLSGHKFVIQRLKDTEKTSKARGRKEW